jgi:hypothetical protein
MPQIFASRKGAMKLYKIINMYQHIKPYPVGVQACGNRKYRLSNETRSWTSLCGLGIIITDDKLLFFLTITCEYAVSCKNLWHSWNLVPTHRCAMEYWAVSLKMFIICATWRLLYYFYLNCLLNFVVLGALLEKRKLIQTAFDWNPYRFPKTQKTYYIRIEPQ